MGVSVAGAAAAQDRAAPLLRFGLTTQVATNSNRTLDTASPGRTSELTSRLDFLMRFATPIQRLEFSGDIGVRGIDGAAADRLSDGLVEPSLSLAYARESRDAELSLDIRVRERDVSATELQFNELTADFDLLDDTGTQLSFGADVALELRRRAPFGVTLSAGYTSLEYSDTTDPSLTDQERFRFGVQFRFDLNPSLQAFVNTRYSTFEDFGTAEGRRETVSLDASLRQQLRGGNAVFRTGLTDTENGTRYTLSAGRTIETQNVALTGIIGLTRDLSGDILPTGEIDFALTLPNSTLGASLRRSVRSNREDDEQQVTTLRVDYARQLTELTAFDAGISFTDRSGTTNTAGGQFGVVSLGLRHDLTQNWRLNVGVQHRFSDSDGGASARDNSLSISLRRDLLVRR